MKKKDFNLILLATLLLWIIPTGILVAQNNTKFWFAAPDVSYLHGNGCDYPVEIVMSTGNKPANVKVTVGNETLVQTTIDANKVHVYTTPNRTVLDKLENSIAAGVAGTVQNKGIYIESDTPISAYYMVNGSCSKDIFTLKSDKALGTKFYVPMQNAYTTANLNDAYDQITIVATENNTTVTATLKGKAYTPSKVYNAGEKLTITLNKGQTYNIRENAKNQSPSLAGTYIESTKPIAVTVTEDALYSPAGNYDLVGDQIVPVENVGTSYVVINGYTQVGGNIKIKDYAYIFATEDNTKVYKYGETNPSATINKGNYYQIEVPKNGAIYFKTDKPSYCYHISGYNGEFGGAILPSMYSISARKISFNRINVGVNKAFLVFRKDKANKFKITDQNGVDRTPSSISVQNITGLSDWQYAKVDLAGVPAGQCTIENSESAFALGYFSAIDGSTSAYGFLSGFGNFSIADNDTTYICGSSYLLDAGYGLSYDWTLPDGAKATSSTITATKSGKYKITVNQDPNTVSDSTYLKFQNFNSILQIPSVGLLDISNKFLVTLNPQNDPDNVYNTKYEWTFGGDASIQNANTAEVLDVKWASLGEKTITLKISNLNALCDTTITRKIQIVNHPDNMSNEDCWITPIGKDWTITQSANFNGNTISNWSTVIPNGVNSMSTPLVADLDGDGIPEIIVPIQNKTAVSNPWVTNGLLIVNAKDKTERVINVTNFFVHGQSIAIADVNKDGKAEIFIEGTDRKIYCYKYDGTLKNTTSTILDNHTIIQIADINNDGIPELIAGNYIFRADGLQLLLNFPFELDGTAYGNPHHLAANTGNGSYYFMPAIGDIDGDGDLEIVAGSTVYDIYIAPNSSSTIGNKLVKTLKVDTSGQPSDFKKYLDGATVLVDFDLDGQLDICVIGNQKTKVNTGSPLQFYVWNPITKKVIAYAPEIAINTDATIPYVGDLDGNGYPDFAFATGNGTIGMISYQYDNTKNGNIQVGKNKTEFAETAGFTMFDFNQDGKSEIVYRGIKQFYIVDGTTLENLSPPMTSYSGTITEYPIVADVDGDGQAEIILTRSDYNWHGGQTNATGILSIYKSGDLLNQPWAPARKVWNQWSYNAVNINEDMIVPQYQISPATVFAGKDGNYTARPFNGYLQQQTALSKDGVPLFLTPNAQIKDANDIQYKYYESGNSLVISNLKITNVGSAPLNAPIKIAVYKDEVPSNQKFVYSYPKSIDRNTTHTISFTITGFSSWVPADQLIIRVNDNGDGYNNQPVCDSCCNNSNSDAFVNIDLRNIAWADSYRKCVGEDVIFDSKTLSGRNVSYKWTKPDGTELSTTTSKTIYNLNTDQAGIYTFTATNVNNSNLTLEKKLPYLSVAPDILYWREDAIDRNWNNIRNWSTSANRKDSIWAVPAPCTSVHIIAGANQYPSLDWGNTDTTVYSKPKVTDIIYHYGGETAFPQNLTYQKAYIQYNFGYYKGSETNGSQPIGNLENSPNSTILKRDRWYMLAAPLKSIASGDFSFAGYPLTWQSRYDAEAIGTDKFKTPYATNHIPILDSYNAISLKVASKGNKTGHNQKYLDGLKGILEIPYFENQNTAKHHPGHSYSTIRSTSSFYYFDTNTLQQIYSPVGSMKRGKEAYRFIFEDESDKPMIIYDGKHNVEGYEIEVSSSSTNNSVIIGNPFMATINAQRFFEVNKDVISGTTYQIFDGSSWQSINYTGSAIAPLQSFLITLKSNSGKLIFPLNGNTPLTGINTTAQIRLSPVDDTNSLFIRSTDKNNNETPYAVLTINEEKFPKTKKLIDQDSHTTPEAFFITEDGKSGNIFDIYQQGMQKVNIAVRTSNTDNITNLDFENVADFAYKNNVHPILIDKLTGIGQNLLENNSYAFNQQKVSKEENYIDYNRFEIQFYNDEDITKNGQEIKITYNNNMLEVNSSNPFNLVDVYDILGRLVYTSGKLTKGTVIYNQDLTIPEGVYVVMVTTQDGNRISNKIICK